jgi:hypothetical protein
VANSQQRRPAEKTMIAWKMNITVYLKELNCGDVSALESPGLGEY